MKVSGNNDVTVRIGLESSTRKGTEASKRDLGDLEQKSKTVTEKMAEQTKRVSASWSKVRTTLVAAAAAFGLYKLYKFAVDVAFTSARVSQLDIVLHNMGKNAGYSKAYLDQLVVAMEKQGIAATNSRENISKMIMAELDLSKSTDLARLAQDAATVANTDSSEAYSRLLNGIITLQPEVLRTMGIIVNGEQAYKKYAKAHHMAAKDIDYNTKQQIFLNEVLKQAPALMGNYEQSMTNPNKLLASMGRVIQNVKIALGDGLQPALVMIMTDLYEFTKSIGLADKAGKFEGIKQSVGDTLVRFYEWIRDVGGMVRDTTSWISEYKDELILLGEVVAIVFLASRIDAYALAVGNITAAYGFLSGAATAVMAKLALLNTSLKATLYTTTTIQAAQFDKTLGVLIAPAITKTTLSLKGLLSTLMYVAAAFTIGWEIGTWLNKFKVVQDAAQTFFGNLSVMWQLAKKWAADAMGFWVEKALGAFDLILVGVSYLPSWLGGDKGTEWRGEIQAMIDGVRNWSNEVNIAADKNIAIHMDALSTIGAAEAASAKKRIEVTKETAKKQGEAAQTAANEAVDAINRESEEYQGYLMIKDQLSMNSTEIAMDNAKREYNSIVAKTKDSVLARQTYNLRIKKLYEDITKKMVAEVAKREKIEERALIKRVKEAERLTKMLMKEEKKRVKEFEKMYKKKMAAVEQFQDDYIRAVRGAYEADVAILMKKADDRIEDGMDEIRVREWVKAELAAMRDKKKEKDIQTVFDVTTFQRQAAQGVSNTLKKMWKGEQRSFESVWNDMLDMFIENMVMMAIQAMTTSKIIQAEMAAATMGLSLVLSLISMIAMGGMGGTSKQIKSLSERMEEVFDDFIENFGDTLADFSFSILTQSEKMAFVSQQIGGNVSSAIGLITDINSAMSIHAGIGAAGVGVAMGSLTPEQKEIKADYLNQIIELLGDDFAQFYRESCGSLTKLIEDYLIAGYEDISEAALQLTDDVTTRYELEKTAIQNISNEIEDLYKRQADWVSGIDKDILSIERSTFSDAELMAAYKGDIGALQGRLGTAATSEEKIGIYSDLRSAYKTYLGQVGKVSGLDSVAYALAQAEVIGGLRDIQEKGKSEFDIMIDVQRDQLEAMTGIRNATEAMAALNVRTEVTLTAIRALGTGEHSAGVISALAEYASWVSAHNLPSHAGGLASVPYDGYVAKLHYKERVLTAEENQSYGNDSPETKKLLSEIRDELKNLGKPGITVTGPLVNIEGTVIADDDKLEEFAEVIDEKLTELHARQFG